MWRDQLMDRFRSPGSRRVKANRWRCLQQGYRNLPEPLDALGGGEQGMVATHGVEDQAFVSLQHVSNQARVMHGELQAELVQPHARTGTLAVKRQRHL